MNPLRYLRHFLGIREMIRGVITFGPYHFDMDVRAGQTHLLSPDYERQLFEWLSANIKQGGRGVDVGAHVGRASLFMGMLVGQNGKIDAIEPVKENQNLLRHNIRLNHLSEVVKIIRAVCSSSEGIEYLFNGPTSFESSLTLDFHKAGYNVRAITLDSLCNEKKIDVVKIDVEGAEAKVLKGASKLLKDDRPSFVMEIHPPFGWEVPVIFGSYEYKPYDLTGVVLDPAVIKAKSIEDDGIRTPFHVVFVP
jgi:FkbM family methyltransferase